VYIELEGHERCQDAPAATLDIHGAACPPTGREPSPFPTWLGTVVQFAGASGCWRLCRGSHTWAWVGIRNRVPSRVGVRAVRGRIRGGHGHGYGTRGCVRERCGLVVDLLGVLGSPWGVDPALVWLEVITHDVLLSVVMSLWGTNQEKRGWRRTRAGFLFSISGSLRIALGNPGFFVPPSVVEMGGGRACRSSNRSTHSVC